MSREYFYGTTRTRRATVPSRKLSGPSERCGTPATGRIIKLFVGQSHGCIRLADERDVFFHRADLADGTAFNDLNIGDAVTFELFEDAVSGARCLRVARRRRSR